jgi:hypothetical protein
VSELRFSVVDVHPDPYAASPSLVMRLRISEHSGVRIDAIALRAQIRLDVQRRGYLPDESALLVELFGEPARYAETLRPMLWQHLAQTVTPFEGQTEVEVYIPCSYDFEVAANKYLASLKDGVIPLSLLFNGVVFVDTPAGATPEFVPWSCEARYELPVTVWREAMDIFFPNAAWIRVNRDIFDELRRFKTSMGLITWDAVLDRLCEIAKTRQ